jgi:hypothetical protein
VRGSIEDLLIADCGLRIADCGFIGSENPVFTDAPLAGNSSPTIIRNPQSAIRNPQSEDPRLTLSKPVCYGCRVVMQSGLRFNLMRPSRLRRGIAIFFLIFTFTELVFEDMVGPRLCCAVGGIDACEELSMKESGWTASVESHSPERPAGPTVLDEDCFCCCPNIIPGVSMIVTALNDSPQPDASTATPLPKAPPRDTFHPPRPSRFSRLTS